MQRLPNATTITAGEVNSASEKCSESLPVTAHFGGSGAALACVRVGRRASRQVVEIHLGFSVAPTKSFTATAESYISADLRVLYGSNKETENGNESAVHWDMVCIQTPQLGGGEIRFDGELIRKDGLFVTADLQGLNPEKLK